MECSKYDGKIHFIKNYRTTLEKVINFSPKSQSKLVSQYRCAGSREVTLPWRLVHRRLRSCFQNFNFIQLKKKKKKKTLKFIIVNFSCNRLKHNDFIALFCVFFITPRTYWFYLHFTLLNHTMKHLYNNSCLNV